MQPVRPSIAATYRTVFERERARQREGGEREREGKRKREREGRREREREREREYLTPSLWKLFLRGSQFKFFFFFLAN